MGEGWRWRVYELTAFLWYDGEVAGDVELIDSPEGEFWEWRVKLGDEAASGSATTRDRAIRDLRAWLATRGLETPEAEAAEPDFAVVFRDMEHRDAGGEP